MVLVFMMSDKDSKRPYRLRREAERLNREAFPKPKNVHGAFRGISS